ncbi:DUF4214 domain-containing protein [Marivita sp. S0852]|uniref:DUF4214 domain-containing protein n=1 Tax=Marivita sp. S0852 TaxID=3373893 RepID=UPI003982BBD9
MAFQTGFFFGPSTSTVIDVVLGGAAWDLEQSTVLSWAIADGLNGETFPDRAFAIDYFGDALAAFEPFIDVTFNYIGAFDDPIAAGAAGSDITYTLESDAFSDTLAFAYYPAEPGTPFELYAAEPGDVFLNLEHPTIADSSFRPGSEGYLTVLHEIGHALGLKHPFETAFGFPAFADANLDNLLETDWISIMSYSDQFELQEEKWDPATPMLLDILALQYMYGPNPTINAGDTVHRLENQEYYYAIADASGTDTIDMSAMSEAWQVILPDGQPSTEVDTQVGFATKLSEYRDALTDIVPTEFVWLTGEIENAIGSQFGDGLIGNDAVNRLEGGRGNDSFKGGGGNDVILGGAGNDTSQYDAPQSAHTVSLRADGITVTDRTATGAGQDTLSEIEFLEFGSGDDRSVFNLSQFGGTAGLTEAELSAFIELYIAYFDRAPDAVGLGFWGTSFADGTTLSDMARLFMTQDETREAYPADINNAAFATVVYDNVLGRTPDQAGFDFWVSALDRGSVTRDQFILEVLNGTKATAGPDASQEFIVQQQADRDYLSAKTEIGATFAVHRGMSDVANAREVMSLFDGSQASLDAAAAAIDQFHAAALDAENGEFLLQIIGVMDPALASDDLGIA